VPGDRIKDIHWKATAKKDELMVKERVRLSENQLALFVDMSGEKEGLEGILELSFNMVKHALREGVPVSLMWWNDGLGDLEESEIMNKNQITKGFRSLFETGINTHTDYAMDYISNVKVKLKNYIVIKSEGQEAKAFVIE
jgi:hypothetical protein